MAEIERGRGDLTLARINKTWTTWRGQVVEPVIRDAVSRLAGDQIPMAEVIGSYTPNREPSSRQAPTASTPSGS
jgi:hypothetical protein